MIEQLLPGTATVVETRADRSDVELSAQEEATIARAVEKRRREFTTVRACARAAFDAIGLPPQPVPTGANGEPVWPPGVVGSMTHCDGYRACAIARAGDLASLGIDAEPNLPLPDGILGDVALPGERAMLAELARTQPAIRWDRLLFSAKESIYKAWFPLARRWLGFEDAALALDPSSGTFSARLLVPGPFVAGRELTSLGGRWLARDGLVLTAVALPAAEGGQAARDPSPAA